MEAVMFVYLESKTEIERAQRALEATLNRAFRRRAVKDIGYPGGTTRRVEVSTDGRYWFWSMDHKKRNVTTPRRLNWFGRFNEHTGLGITVEVNTSYEGRNDRAAGFFARDRESGAVYLVHSGRVGGGKRGVGKNAFRAWSNEPLVEVIDSRGHTRHGILVTSIKGATASHSVSRYINLVRDFKRAVDAGQIATPAFQRKQKDYEDFYSEGRGRRRGRRSSLIDYVSHHGDVVDALHAWRKARQMPRHARLVKNVYIDLGVTSGGNLVEVFEVKPSAARQSIYSALGQLMVHGNADNCRRTVVLPQSESLSNDLRKAFARLGVQLLRFRLDKGAATIVDRL
jgi:hypothetical protein